MKRFGPVVLSILALAALAAAPAHAAGPAPERTWGSYASIHGSNIFEAQIAGTAPGVAARLYA